MLTRRLAPVSLAQRWPRLVWWPQALTATALLLCAFHSPSAAATTRVITVADKGSEVQVAVGDKLEVRLKSNPSTGFMWYVHRDSTRLVKLTGQQTTAPEAQMPGSPTFQIFRFLAQSPGKGVLLLHYVRSWESPAPDETRFALKVKIQ